MKNTPCPRITFGALTQGPSPNPSTREGSIIYFLMWALVSCNYSLPLWEGWGGVRTPYYENTLHPSVRGAGRKILVSSRLGPRVESAVNMNEQAHDNMSASHGRCENGKENEKT